MVARRHSRREMLKLNEKYGTTAMYHRHSGPGNVGGGVWDLWLLLKDFDPAYVGINYDVKFYNALLTDTKLGAI